MSVYFVRRADMEYILYQEPISSPIKLNQEKKELVPFASYQTENRQ